MPSFPVTTKAVQLSQVITQGASIQNNGPDTLYLSTDSAVSPGSFSMRVTPGASVNWPANGELWGVSDGTSLVGILFGAGFASVSQVSAVVNGSLTVNGASAVIPLTIVSAPPNVYYETTADLSPYQTLVLDLVNVGTSLGTPNIYPVVIAWYDANGNYILSEQTGMSQGGNLETSHATWTVPVLGATFIVTYVGGGSVNAYGIRQTLPRRFVHSMANPAITAPPPGGFYATYFATLGTGTGANSWSVPSVSGPCDITVRGSASFTSGSLLVSLNAFGSSLGQVLELFSMPFGQTSLFQRIQMPAFPVMASVYNGSGVNQTVELDFVYNV